MYFCTSVRNIRLCNGVQLIEYVKLLEIFVHRCYLPSFNSCVLITRTNSGLVSFFFTRIFWSVTDFLKSSKSTELHWNDRNDINNLSNTLIFCLNLCSYVFNALKFCCDGVNFLSFGFCYLWISYVIVIDFSPIQYFYYLDGLYYVYERCDEIDVFVNNHIFRVKTINEFFLS